MFQIVCSLLMQFDYNHTPIYREHTVFMTFSATVGPLLSGAERRHFGCLPTNVPE